MRNKSKQPPIHHTSVHPSMPSSNSNSNSNIMAFVPLAACMTLINFTFASASSAYSSLLFVHQTRSSPIKAKLASQFYHQRRSRLLAFSTTDSSLSRHRAISTVASHDIIASNKSRSASARCCYNHLFNPTTVRKIMTTTTTSSLKESSQEGLSDIGNQKQKGGNKKNKHSNNEKEDGETTTIKKNWKERIDVSIAKSRKIRGSNYVQISTINYETMEPHCRTVVFRGFLKDVPFGAIQDVLNPDGSGGDGDGKSEDGDSSGQKLEYTDCVMKMITDLRSNKVQELGMFHNDETMKKIGKNKNCNTVEMVWW